MEKLKAKHDHKLTDILKVAIFGIFLILPFMVYAPNALYYGVNEYAVAQEKTEEQPIYYESNEVNTIDDIIADNIYKYNPSYVAVNVGSENSICDINIDFAKTQFPQIYNLNVTRVRLYYVPSSFLRLAVNYNTIDTMTLNINDADFNFIPTSINNTLFSQTILPNVSYTNYKYIKEYQEVTYTMSIAESMNTAWQQTWETPMFNWTSESVLKQGLDNFTGVFGVSDTSYFTNLIIYELIMVAIYIVIDIVITMFKWLTHLIGEK